LLVILVNQLGQVSIDTNILLEIDSARVFCALESPPPLLVFFFTVVVAVLLGFVLDIKPFPKKEFLAEINVHFIRKFAQTHIEWITESQLESAPETISIPLKQLI